jgi:hypothetical protein
MLESSIRGAGMWSAAAWQRLAPAAQMAPVALDRTGRLASPLKSSIS